MVSFRKHKRLTLSLALLALIIAASVVYLVHLNGVHKSQHQSGTIPTSKKSSNTNSGTTADQNTPTTTNNSNTSSTSTDTKLPNVSAEPSTELVTPFGTFVSNHKPGQNGSPTSEQSVCNTTPGAQCDIQFKSADGVVKTLGTETVSNSGTAYWSWDVKGATLAPGKWQITAVATLNGQTKTSNDPILLEVQ